MNPYLIDELKFDLRIYVLLKSVSPLKIFIYKEGLARFATSKYEKPSKFNIQDFMMHLTNYAVNKKSPNFIFNEKEKDDDIGHKRSLTSVLNVNYLNKIKVINKNNTFIINLFCLFLIITIILFLIIILSLSRL